MEVEFMTTDTTLPPCMPLPRAMLRLPISSTAKVMYARMLDIIFLTGGGTCPQHHDREAFSE